MATKATNATPEPPAETPAVPILHVVTEAFVTQVNGALVVYRKGKIVPSNDPYLRAMPGRFTPFDPLHPPKQRGRAVLTVPEVMS